MVLSETVKELIGKARIISFATWHETHPLQAIQYFQTADDEGRYLTDADAAALQQLAPETSVLMPVALQLRDRASDIVDEARSHLLNEFPTITNPGGGLYPPERASACWRDFWHFLRCITYGIAGQHTDYLSPEGLHYMEKLYQELHVPLDAMVVGLHGIKTASLNQVDQATGAAIAPYFDPLIAELAKFRGSSAET